MSNNNGVQFIEKSNKLTEEKKKTHGKTYMATKKN